MNFKYISKTVYKIYDFISWQKNNSLVLSPSFQRRPVWNKSAKSYLIDTIIRGLPIPIVFIREQTSLQNLEPVREVVDGQQRLRTIISFIDPTLLADYKSSRDEFTIKKSHNSHLANKGFTELESTIQQRILNYEFSVHVFPAETEDTEILQIFARMNSTGVKLNRQELRNAEYFGSLKETMYEIAYTYLKFWRKWSVFSENDIARMREVEMVSELAYTMHYGLKSKSQPSLDKFYKEFDEEYPYSKSIKKRFDNVLNMIDSTVSDFISTTSFSNKGLFNTLFTYYYDKLFGLKPDFDQSKPNKVDRKKLTRVIKHASDLIDKKDLSDELLKVLRGGTGNLESKKMRLDFLRDIESKIDA